MDSNKKVEDVLEQSLFNHMAISGFLLLRQYVISHAKDDKEKSDWAEIPEVLIKQWQDATLKNSIEAMKSVWGDLSSQNEDARVYDFMGKILGDFMPKPDEAIKAITDSINKIADNFRKTVISKL
jgi:hypothetical protein